MIYITKYLIIFIVFCLQGCQQFNHLKPILNSQIYYNSLKSFGVKQELSEQEQVYQLLSISNAYRDLLKEDQQRLCKQLKQEYKVLDDWQTAWLLVYALNHNFNCMSKKNAHTLLLNIHSKLDPSFPLYWLNFDRIQQFSSFSSLQSKTKKINRKFLKLKSNLNQSKEQLVQLNMQLKEMESKIQTLKAFETSINKKLNNDRNTE